MAKIFEKVRLGNLELKNHLVRSATWEALADRDGGPVAEQIEIYDELAQGGTGLIITGFTSVSASDMYFGGMARISSDALAQRWAKVADVCHTEGVPVIMQLALGEYVRDRLSIEVDDLTDGDIKDVIALFGDAAKRAKDAGFDGVQIHAAHGFFLSRFISPFFNHRRDAYGGSVKGRAKILGDILADIRKKAPGIHVTMKINCSDFLPGGLDPRGAMETILIMEKAGLDSVEVSGNGTSVAGIRAGVNEGYFLPFAKGLKPVSRLPVILVGGFRSIECINSALADGIDLISLSRPLVREPDLPSRWEKGDTAPAACVSCNSCYNTPGHRCIFAGR